MCKVKFVVLFLSFFACIMLNSSTSYADSNNPDQDILENYFPDYYQGYRYPVLPGMSTWPHGNHADMVVACSIPQNVLDSMTTSELVESILYYPLAIDVLLYDNIEIAYQTLNGYVNAFRELSNRSDRAECLYTYWNMHYMSIQSEIILWQNDGFTGTHALPSQMFVFLSEQEDYKEYTKGSFGNKVQCERSDIACSDGITYEEIQNRNITPVSFDSIVGKQADTSVYDWLSTSHATDVVKGYFPKVIEKWLCSDGYYHNIIFDDLTTTAKTSIRSSMQSSYNLSPYSGETVEYNCHAYAWIVSNDKYTHWVDDVVPTGYNVTNMQSISNGGLVVYCMSTGNSINNLTIRSHSAIVVSKIYHPVHFNTVVGLNLNSKWGMAGRYYHTMENCPYYYYPISPYIADTLYYE